MKRKRTKTPRGGSTPTPEPPRTLTAAWYGQVAKVLKAELLAAELAKQRLERLARSSKADRIASSEWVETMLEPTACVADGLPRAIAALEYLFTHQTVLEIAAPIMRAAIAKQRADAKAAVMQEAPGGGVRVRSVSKTAKATRKPRRRGSL